VKARGLSERREILEILIMAPAPDSSSGLYQQQAPDSHSEARSRVRPEG
jgi:hypothetical protein